MIRDSRFVAIHLFLQFDNTSKATCSPYLYQMVLNFIYNYIQKAINFSTITDCFAINNSLNANKDGYCTTFTVIPLEVYFFKCFIIFAVTEDLHGYNFINLI